MPLGYECVIFEKLARAGGLMRINIPSFRLPAQVLDEEIGLILDMGVDVRYNTPVDEHARAARRGLRRGLRRQRRAEGKGARHPRPLGRAHARTSTSASSGWRPCTSATSTSIGERVLIIGVGNTAMDCCRTLARLGGAMSRSWRAARARTSRRRRGSWRTPKRKAVQIVENHAPKSFVLENGNLVGA